MLSVAKRCFYIDFIDVRRGEGSGKSERLSLCLHICPLEIHMVCHNSQEGLNLDSSLEINI